MIFHDNTGRHENWNFVLKIFYDKLSQFREIIEIVTRKVGSSHPASLPTIASERLFHSSTVNCHGGFEWRDAKSEDEVVNVVYVNREGKDIPIRGKVGDNVMYLAHRHNIEIEGK